MNKPKFQITNESITLIYNGNPITVRKGQSNFKALSAALVNEHWEDVEKHLTPTASVLDWLLSVNLVDFSLHESLVFYKNEELPEKMQNKINEMVAKGESPLPLVHFWERLQRNPSSRSVNQLWGFLGHCNIPLTEDGCFLAYKKVRDDFMDFHTGTVSNVVGSVHEMPRNKISDDPNEACHFGFHVGSFEYANNNFQAGSGRLVICKVDPEHVVSVPNDVSCQKMRVCKYVVEGHYGVPLSNTSHKETYQEDEDSTLDYDGASAEETAGYLDDSERWEAMDGMGTSELLDFPIAKLRTYAGKHLFIVGASKIPGGKTALIKQIMKTRK